MRHHLTIKYLAALLATILLALPQVAHCQEEEYEFEDPNQATIDSLLNTLRPDTPDSVKASIYYTLSEVATKSESQLQYALLSLEHCDENDLLLIANNCEKIGGFYYLTDQANKALPYIFKAAKLYNKLSMPTDEALIYNLIGNCYEDLNITDSIFFFFNKALRSFIDLNDTANITYTYCLMGRVYFNMDLHVTADETYWKALHYATLANDTMEMATCYYFIGTNYSKLDTSLSRSLVYLKKSASLLESKDFKDIYYINIKYDTYSSLASVYIDAAKSTGKKEYADSCYMYINKLSLFHLSQGYYSNYVIDRHIYVQYLLFYKRYHDALTEMMRLTKYTKEVSSVPVLKEYHFLFYKVYSSLGDYKNALEHFEKYDKYRFSFLNDSTLNTIKNAELERTRMIEELKRENAEKLHAAEKRRMHVIIISLWVGLGLVVVVIGLIFRVLVIKKRSNAELSLKNELLSERKEEIETQRDTIKAQSDEIQASINYARRIQYSLLTPDETISRIFPDHFLLYKPRNVVSGDFYWVGQFGDNKVCIVADCTGHGVPGGFLSVLGMSNLNYIVGQDVSPDIILNRLREAIIANLRQTNNAPSTLLENGELDPALYRNCDGMDAAVYIVNERLMKLSFAGANNPLVLIRGSEMRVLKADKMPVGIYARLNPFECTSVDLQNGDCIYTFSDGFQDQFGNGVHEKFTAQRLRDLLLEIHTRPMEEQKEMLNSTYEQWRGPVGNQTDDMVIMGIRI